MVHLVSVNLKDTLVATSSRICVPPSSSVGLWPDQPRLICDHFWQWGQDFVKEESQIDHMCCIGLEETRSSALCGGLGANYNSKSWCIFKSTSTSTLYSPSHDASLIIYPYMYPACQSRKQNPALLILNMVTLSCRYGLIYAMIAVNKGVHCTCFRSFSPYYSRAWAAFFSYHTPTETRLQLRLEKLKVFSNIFL